MQTKDILKNPIAIAVSLAFGVIMMNPVYAEASTDESTMTEDAAQDSTENNSQDDATDDNTDDNTITVTGIRGSLMQSMDTKRNSTGVVDAINSEDMGKFPDTNLAESLQRIPGVSIDRQRGEGSRVSVRGWGADFNLVTLNGRQMPTNSGFGRSFDFGDLASESVSAVEIYKTARASVPTGGIGATIDVKTNRPLRTPGLKASFGVKAVNDTSTIEGDTFTPEVSGIYSNTFFDDTVGVSLTGSFQERNNGQASAHNSEWKHRDGSVIPDNGFQTNAPVEGDLVSLPQQIGYTLDEWERTRTNGQLTLQWRPIEDFTASLDYTYAELELDHRYNNMSIWFSDTGQSGTWSDGPIVSPLIYTEFDDQPDIPMGAGVDASRNKMDSIGLNLDWQVNDRLSLTLDYHDSTSDRGPNSPYGSSALITIASFARQSASVDYTGGIPVTTIIASDPLSPDDMQITGSVFGNSWAEMNIEQTALSGTFEINAESSIDFGVSLSKTTNFESGTNVQRNTWGQNSASAYGSISDLMTPASLAGVFDAISGGGNVTNNFFVFDMATLAQRAEFLQSLDPDNSMYLATALTEGDCGTGFCADSDPGFGNQFIEETTAVYVQYTHIGEIAELPYNLLIGLRYEETDVTSSAESEDYVEVVWSSANEFIAMSGDDLIPSGLQDTYDVLLPSIDFDIELSYDIKLRASYSKSIARADYESLRGNLTIGEYMRYQNGLATATGSIGNPGLQPFESDNYDLSLEWYYDDGSYVSGGFFSKSVVNWITATEVEDVVLFPGLAHPALGSLYQNAVTALGGSPSNTEIRDYIFANYPNADGVDVDAQTITGVVGRDSDAYFDVSTSINSDNKETIDGFEIAWQHDFIDTGFGFIVNATFTSGSAEYDRLVSSSDNYGLVGLSDTRNLIAYYDKDGIQVRIAYNWRDTFFNGGSLMPAYVDEYEQWDINASYDYSEKLTIFFEGINLTNEINRSYARDYKQSYSVGQTGPRYNLGFRYTFQ